MSSGENCEVYPPAPVWCEVYEAIYVLLLASLVVLKSSHTLNLILKRDLQGIRVILQTKCALRIVVCYLLVRRYVGTSVHHCDGS